MSVLQTNAGNFVSNGFYNVFDSTQVRIAGDSIFIAPRDTNLVPVYKDVVLTENSVDSSYAPEVLALEGDTFIFIWSEWENDINTIYQRKVALSIFNVSVFNPTPLDITDNRDVQYLNARTGKTASDVITAFYVNGNVIVRYQSSDLSISSKPNNSICHLGNDTFALIYKEDNYWLNMRKIHLNSGALTFIDNGTPLAVSANPSVPTGNFSNISTAADSSGNMLIMITRGGSQATKYLRYKLTNSHNDANDTGTVANGISLNTAGDIKYADAPLVSYANKKFAAVYWSSTGIYLYKLEIDGNPPSVISTQTDQIVGGGTYRAPSLTTNGKKLLIAWKNYNPGDEKIEGKVLTINNGTLSAIPSNTQTFSDNGTKVDTAGPELNLALSSVGSFALTWRQGNNAVGALWADRAIIYPTAQWISEVETFSLAGDDSVVYLAGVIDTSLNNGAISCSLQVGPTSDTTTGWSSWIDLGSSSQLTQYTLGANNFFRYKVNFVRPVIDSILTPVLRQVTVNWNVKPVLKSLDSVRINGIKVTDFSGFNDTIEIISLSDTLDCYFNVHENDIGDSVFVSIPWAVQSLAASDTVTGSQTELTGSLRLFPGTVWDTIYSCTYSGVDNKGWSIIPQKMFIKARKASPVITSVTFDGVAYANNSIKIITLNSLSTVQVNIERPHIVNWNIINYRFITNLFDTTFSSSNQLTYRTSENDSIMRIMVTDQYSATDTMLLIFKYPQYTIDSSTNPGYFNTKKTVADSLSYILGGKDSSIFFTLPLRNTGNYNLTLDSIFFSATSRSWLRLGIPSDTGMIYYDSLTSTHNISPLTISPGSQDSLTINIRTSLLTGDAVVFDTLFIWTNDPLYPIDTIPIKLEYNDLPIIAAVSSAFTPGTPYWLEGTREPRTYRFPPHARIMLSFSESIDSISAVGKIFAFSIFDSLQDNQIDTIPLTQEWHDNYTRLHLRPHYRVPSTYFNGLQPPAKFFIPTDSIAVRVISDLRDQANTPSSPNYLDINQDFVRDTGTDSTITLRIDSIHFTLDSVSPKVSATIASSENPIIMYFSSPIYPGTVDLSLENNRTLLITTKFNSQYNPLKQISFSRVTIDSTRVIFFPARKFFFGDSVYCYYRGVSARDSLGYSIDINQDGIAIGLFDSASAADDFSWSFYINDITLDSIIPDSSVRDVDLTTPITLLFSSPLFPGTIDTAKTGNRSLIITSRYSQGNQIDYNRIRVNGNRVDFYLDHRLFYADSVFCDFRGLVSQDTAGFSIDLGIDTIMATNMGKSWFFWIKDLVIESVSPDSATPNAGIRDPIVMNFSGPLSPLIFDTTLDADSNRSFFYMTSYSGGRRMPISHMAFSLDSSTITVYTQKAFYSFDSIYCEFIGFKSGYSYQYPSSLVPTDTVDLLGSYSWYFLTGNDGFYTYPNPFKPGSQIRHQRLGGIWFKNLHAAAKERGSVNDIKIKVFNINTHPVFESPLIHFEEHNQDQKPEWFWNTRNNKGSPLASGVYFYALYDKNNNILLKGKILIVR